MRRADNSDMHQISKFVHANDAGLRWFEQMKANYDPKDKMRCVMGANWICPFFEEGRAFPCQTPETRRDLLVKIGYVNWVENYEPIGQMSMFAPSVTHKRVRRHAVTGKELPLDSDPVMVTVFCKRMSIAYVKLLEKEGWKVQAWRIMPLGKMTKEHQRWAAEQMRKHRMKACVFEGDI